RRGASADAEDARQSRWLAHRGVRPNPRRSSQRPIAILQGIDHAVLWREPARLQGLARPAGFFWLQGMMAGHKACYDCIKSFSETDFTEDLKRFDVPTLILHGDDDQIVPIGASALRSSKLVKGATLKVIAGAPHGMCSTLKNLVNAELLAFFKDAASSASA